MAFSSAFCDILLHSYNMVCSLFHFFCTRASLSFLASIYPHPLLVEKEVVTNNMVVVTAATEVPTVLIRVMMMIKIPLTFHSQSVSDPRNSSSFCDKIQRSRRESKKCTHIKYGSEKEEMEYPLIFPFPLQTERHTSNIQPFLSLLIHFFSTRETKPGAQAKFPIVFSVTRTYILPFSSDFLH